MGNGGIWQPPQAGASRPPPALPLDVALTTETAPAFGGRSRGKVIAAVVGAVAIIGAGVFAISQLAGDSAAGGAATPEEAGLAMLAAIEDEDVLGMIDVLLPGERDTLRGPVTDLVGELRRLEVLSDDASLSDVGGVDFVVEDESVEVSETGVEDIANLQIKAAVRGSIDGEALPIGAWIRENVDEDLSTLDTVAEEAEEGTLPLTAVREDGRWYLSLLYTAAESIRGEGGVEIPTEGIEPVGGDSPEAAVDVLLGAIERLDVAAVLATLNPDEFQALQRYAPLFIDDLQDELDAIEGVSIAFPHRTYEVSGSGDTRDVTMTRLTAEITADGQSATIDLNNGCWTMESAGERVDSCDTPDGIPPLDEVVDDPEQIEQLMQTLQATFDDYDQPGLIVERVDGKWFFSPMATGSEQLLALIRALSREEIENLQEQVMDLSGSFDDDVLDRENWPVLAGDEETGATEASVPADDDPAEECWVEVEATAAGACFRALVDAGEVDATLVPWYLRFPECGVAETGWSGEYYSLPDAEFAALVEEVAPCFQDLLAVGQVEEPDLPYEMVSPQCLEGRNWYTQTDEAWIDAFDDCVLAG